MSAVRTPRALGRSVGLSAARPPGAAARNCSGQSAACAPWASMAFTRKRLREQQLQLYSKERCAGREAGKGGSRGLSCRSRPPPGPQSRGWARLAGDTRDAKAGPFPCSPAGPPARPHARRPQPASPHRPSAPCSRPAWEAGVEAACGRAVAVSRGPGRTWVELRPPSDPVPSQESGLPPSVSFPGLFAPAGDSSCGSNGNAGYIDFFGDTGFVGGSWDRTVALSLSGASKAVYARTCRCSFYSGWLCGGSPHL